MDTSLALVDKFMSLSKRPLTEPNEVNPERVFDETGLNVIFFTATMNTAIPSIITYIAISMHLANHDLPKAPNIWFWDWWIKENRDKYVAWYKSINMPLVITRWMIIAAIHDLYWGGLNTMLFFFRW